MQKIMAGTNLYATREVPGILKGGNEADDF